MTTSANGRDAAHPVDPLFLKRWSPRAFTGEKLPEADLMTMLEAARWAPSSYNSQPWRFIYAHRGTPAWDKLFPTLVEFNQGWVKTASVLMFAVSKETMPMGDKQVPSHTHSFDAGAAWCSLALQASLMGYQAHGMSGVDFAKAKDALKVPDGFRVEAAIAIGRQGDKAQLPEAMQARETPSGRNPLSAFVFEGEFRG